MSHSTASLFYNLGECLPALTHKAQSDFTTRHTIEKNLRRFVLPGGGTGRQQTPTGLFVVVNRLSVWRPRQVGESKGRIAVIRHLSGLAHQLAINRSNPDVVPTVLHFHEGDLAAARRKVQVG